MLNQGEIVCMRDLFDETDLKMKKARNKVKFSIPAQFKEKCINCLTKLRHKHLYFSEDIHINVHLCDSCQISYR